MSQVETTEVVATEAAATEPVLDLPELVVDGLDKVDRKVVNLARLIKSRGKIDTFTGLREKDDGLAEATFSEGMCDPRLTYDLFKLAQEHEGNVYNANKIATADAGIDAMKENKDLQRATVPFNMGVRDQVTVSVDRKATYPNPQKPEEPIVKFGATTVKYDVRSSHNVGVLKSVRAEISKLAAESLK